jgi:cytochrome c556
MKRTMGVFALSGIFCFCISTIGFAEEFGKSELKEQMQVKLRHFQDVLEGIVLEDVEKIKKGANNLVTMCEIVGWTEEKTTGKFEEYDTQFHHLAEDLVTLAEALNLEGVQNKYNHMVMTCIHCHQHVRDVEAPEKYMGEIHEGEPMHKGRHIHSR